MRKTTLTDAALCLAVDEMEQGLLDADLGGHVVKKRVALPGRGKSGGVRTLVATRKAKLWFFVFGFEKKLVEELREVDEKLTSWMKQKDAEKANLQKKIEKETVKKKVKRK